MSLHNRNRTARSRGAASRVPLPAVNSVVEGYWLKDKRSELSAFDDLGPLARHACRELPTHDVDVRKLKSKFVQFRGRNYTGGENEPLPGAVDWRGADDRAFAEFIVKQCEIAGALAKPLRARV